jgi:glycosyltransferase involved in cell wall biosynthesis
VSSTLRGSNATARSGANPPSIGLVGPLPPPSGGMANQARQLHRLLVAEGLRVEFVQTNAPSRPAWIDQLPIIRAGFRLLPYLLRLWQTAGHVDVMHLFANSGWAWHLFASPAIVIARMRKVPVIVNYRGGHADVFFSTAPKYVLNLLAKVHQRVTPSPYLKRVFAKFGLPADVIPNVIDLSRFVFSPGRPFGQAPCLVVTRNLERIYDIPLAIRVLARVRAQYPDAQLVVCGSGPEQVALQSLAAELGLTEAVTFTGRVDSADMPGIYAKADCMLNPSTVDNMPNAILEAFACGVPVVSTDAGGIPDMAVHGATALLSPTGDVDAMAGNVLRVLKDTDLATRLRDGGLAEARKYDWPVVKEQWLRAYRHAASGEVVAA